jgi:hypothetical protein
MKLKVKKLKTKSRRLMAQLETHSRLSATAGPKKYAHRLCAAAPPSRPDAGSRLRPDSARLADAQLLSNGRIRRQNIRPAAGPARAAAAVFK